MSQIKKRAPVVSFILGEKKFLINADFQIQFIASLILISIVSMSIIYLANDYAPFLLLALLFVLILESLLVFSKITCVDSDSFVMYDWNDSIIKKLHEWIWG